ncbi:hypothetical protein [Streptomyces sp. NPDC051636]|uniref:hypothetical protein n=1 Tax=Streptomyces sp. NPDC051636 TaxID=3365663 RepID=UPI0037914D53
MPAARGVAGGVLGGGGDDLVERAAVLKYGEGDAIAGLRGGGSHVCAEPLFGEDPAQLRPSVPRCW